MKDSVHIYNILLQKKEEIDYKPIQYISGFMVLADDHSSYHPQSKKQFSERIVRNDADYMSKYSMKVEDTKLTFSKNDEQVV